jgi:hypothetical protein
VARGEGDRIRASPSLQTYTFPHNLCIFDVCTNASDQRKRAHNIEKKDDIEQLIQISIDDANIKLKRKITKQTVDRGAGINLKVVAGQT